MYSGFGYVCRCVPFLLSVALYRGYLSLDACMGLKCGVSSRTGELERTHAMVLSRHSVVSMSGNSGDSYRSSSANDSWIALSFAFAMATRLLANMVATSFSCWARACCRRFSSYASHCFISFSFSAIGRSCSACSFAAAASAAALSLATLEEVDAHDSLLRCD